VLSFSKGLVVITGMSGAFSLQAAKGKTAAKMQMRQANETSILMAGNLFLARWAFMQTSSFHSIVSAVCKLAAIGSKRFAYPLDVCARREFALISKALDLPMASVF
jgi:hypothetical protein